jgi:hypothetical protein
MLRGRFVPRAYPRLGRTRDAVLTRDSSRARLDVTARAFTLNGVHDGYVSQCLAAPPVGATSRLACLVAPDDANHDGALSYPNRVGPCSTPQELRAVAGERYGWNDYCQTCGTLARKCGHRMPETREHV